ncbi:MAG: YIP1 family protein [Chloroflexi bacterium]|nr:YIP1 family protein [Chloroflexota bacterium]
MQTITNLLRLGVDALFLRDEAYVEMSNDEQPLRKGLVLVILVGVLVGFVGVIGTTLEWASTPSFAAMKQAIWETIAQSEWYQMLQQEAPEALHPMKQYYDLGWRIASLFAPNPAGAILNVIFIPVGLMISWVIYSVLAHLFARLLGGTGDLGRTMGCTALAISPNLIGLVKVLPYIQLGSVVGIWVLVCDFLALKAAHQLVGWRAFWAALLPLVTLCLLFGLLACCSGFAIASFLGSMLSQGGQ